MALISDLFSDFSRGHVQQQHGTHSVSSKTLSSARRKKTPEQSLKLHSLVFSFWLNSTFCLEQWCLGYLTPGRSNTRTETLK
uniref:Uncharacterized protein n=1 Tax=Anguilla anguilla TaxID=7936 RepID=A0A0E9X6H0_ANGAN